jgi:hypothetical protein
VTAPPATFADIDLGACHRLAAEVRSTERLIRVVEDLVEEILGRFAAHEAEVDRIYGGHDEFDGPSRMDLILRLADHWDARRGLLDVADRICEALEEEAGPPSVRVRYWRMLFRLVETNDLPISAIFEAFDSADPEE